MDGRGSNQALAIIQNIFVMKIKVALLILLTIWVTSCSQRNAELITLGFQKDLIPEGIAIDTKSKTIFLNSLRHGKIVACKLDGSDPTTFITNNQYGYLPGFGMTIKGDTLYALGNSSQRESNQSILLLLNLRTRELIDSYPLNDTSFIYLNDLAISSKNEIFITDSESNKVYTINRAHKEMEVYLETDEIVHSNGITISDDDKYLYVASQKGIRVVDIQSKKILNQSNKSFAGIDGLKIYGNSLIGIVNAWRDDTKNGVFRYHLNDDGSSIIAKKKIIPFGENFKIPTTFDIVNDSIYFVINSQLDNLGDDDQIIDSTTLEPYLLLKKKLD
jgi:hypothetical protein